MKPAIESAKESHVTLLLRLYYYGFYQRLFSFHKATISRVQKGRPRLLLIDNHRSYTTIEFTQFCTAKNIIPAYFLPYTTHICQPLDSEAFQYLKHYFRTINNERVNKLNLKLLNNVKKLENLSQDFKRHIRRSIQANTFLSQQLDLVKESLKTSQFHKSAANQPKKWEIAF
ncbi:hypothetical protein N7517_007440 [Penicillium concentricum]|uniref:DDE-1 domain-containing protein n=1 Tax=Penicillium concentricum TaxID=293559 RepID=A0A9W9SD77_9EURO|nr:uncharacterized protein N7517_007440 [Penicillium concentricum]KAJ5375434.1 hypothetical protein N7517_007440 [Penicillium concentricum]